MSDRTKSMNTSGVRRGCGEGHDGRVELHRRGEGLAVPLQAVVTAFSRAEIMHRCLQGDCGKIELPFLSGRAFRWMKAEMYTLRF